MSESETKFTLTSEDVHRLAVLKELLGASVAKLDENSREGAQLLVKHAKRLSLLELHKVGLSGRWVDSLNSRLNGWQNRIIHSLWL